MERSHVDATKRARFVDKLNLLDGQDLMRRQQHRNSKTDLLNVACATSWRWIVVGGHGSIVSFTQNVAQLKGESSWISRRLLAFCHVSCYLTS
jgi:hypothetical protein